MNVSNIRKEENRVNTQLVYVSGSTDRMSILALPLARTDRLACNDS